MTTRGILRAALPVVALLVLSGHVGDGNTYFRGDAGPWPIQVVVRHPGVVPGLADVTVRIEEGEPATVTVQLVQASLGVAGAPRPDVAEPVPGEPGLFAAQLWFMTLGTYAVYVEIDGDRGAGTAVVPVTSSATRTLPMGLSLGAMLAGLGLFLAVGFLTIVRAAVGESTVPPGEDVPPARRRRAWTAVAIAAVLLGLAVTGGRAWWNAEAAAYRRILFEPLDLQTASAIEAGRTVLDFRTGERNWLGQELPPIVPDHGKMMHAFLVRMPEQDAFAHVHPVAAGDRRFRLVAPPLPPGRYAFYGDVVHESGFAQTLVGEVELAAPAECLADLCAAADPDDSWWSGSAAEGDAYVYDDGVRIRMDAGGFSAGREREIRFTATDAAGDPVVIQPYMGMAAHAAIQRDDGAVFVHLHPTGSVSLAAQAAVAARAGLPVAFQPTGHDMAMGSRDGTVSILYAFPEPGTYLLWLQIRTAEGVRTAAWQVVAGEQ